MKLQGLGSTDLLAGGCFDSAEGAFRVAAHVAAQGVLERFRCDAQGGQWKIRRQWRLPVRLALEPLCQPPLPLPVQPGDILSGEGYKRGSIDAPISFRSMPCLLRLPGIVMS
jgi:hypothetical protein